MKFFIRDLRVGVRVENQIANYFLIRDLRVGVRVENQIAN